MFKFKTEKNNESITLLLEGGYSIAEVDIALKDICIYLKSQLANKENFIAKVNGHMIVCVKDYDKKLSEREQYLIDRRMMPINEVIMEHDGFSFEEIQQTMHSFQISFPENFRNNFMYYVNFEKLIIR